MLLLKKMSCKKLHEKNLISSRGGNGIRTGLKILGPKGIEGSTPFESIITILPYIVKVGFCHCSTSSCWLIYKVGIVLHYTYLYGEVTQLVRVPFL